MNIDLPKQNKSHRKLLFISSLKNNLPTSSTSAIISPNLSHRDKLIKHREVHLHKIRNQISDIIQQQIRYDSKNRASSDFSKCNLQKICLDLKISDNIDFKRRYRNKRKSSYIDKSSQNLSFLLKDQINNLEDNLIAFSKRLQKKQKKQNLLNPKKLQKSLQVCRIEDNSLPMILNNSKAKFNRVQPKISPWKFKNEDYHDFQL